MSKDFVKALSRVLLGKKAQLGLGYKEMTPPGSNPQRVWYQLHHPNTIAAVFDLAGMLGYSSLWELIKEAEELMWETFEKEEEAR